MQSTQAPAPKLKTDWITTMKSTITALALASIALSACDAKKFDRQEDTSTCAINERLPLEIWSVRDGGSKRIDVNGGKSEGGWSLYFSRSRVPNAGRDWILFDELTHPDDEIQPRQITRDLALPKIQAIEDIILEHFSMDSDQVRTHLAKYANLSGEEAFEYRSSRGIAADEIEAFWILNLLEEFRCQQ